MNPCRVRPRSEEVNRYIIRLFDLTPACSAGKEQLHVITGAGDHVIPNTHDTINQTIGLAGVEEKTIPWLTPGRRLQGGCMGWRIAERPSQVEVAVEWQLCPRLRYF